VNAQVPRPRSPTTPNKVLFCLEFRSSVATIGWGGKRCFVTFLLSACTEDRNRVLVSAENLFHRSKRDEMEDESAIVCFSRVVSHCEGRKTDLIQSENNKKEGHNKSRCNDTQDPHQTKLSRRLTSDDEPPPKGHGGKCGCPFSKQTGAPFMQE
jgi:hypothetical protein